MNLARACSLFLAIPLMFLSLSADPIEALHLQLLDAGPNEEIVHVDADVNGLAALSIPSLRSANRYGSSMAFAATGSLVRTGNQLSGDLAATVRSGALPGQGSSHPLQVSIAATIDADGLVDGTWTAIGNARSGIVSGLLTEFPPEESFNLARILLNAGFPANWSGLTASSDYSRVGITADLENGVITQVLLNQDRPRGTSVFTFTAILSIDPYGRPHYINPHLGSSAIPGTGTGEINQSAFSGAISSPHAGGTNWTFELQRAGSLLFGTWSGTTGGASGSGFASGRLGFRESLQVPLGPDSTDPMDIVTAHSRALVEHPFIGPFRDALLLMSRTETTGDKQYDNAPYNVAGAVIAGLTLERTSPEPREQRIGRMIARNGGEFWRIRRGAGALGLPVVYKGNSWMQAAGVEALGLLATAEPASSGLLALANQASSTMAAYSRQGNDWNWLLNEAQWGWLDTYDFHILSDPSWVWWTHFESDGSGMGISDSRNDRSRDHRRLPFGELIAAMRIVRELDGGFDSWSREVGHHQYLYDTLDIAPYWMIRHRAAASSTSPLSPVAHVGWFQWLVETGHADEAAIDAVEAFIRDTFVGEFFGVPEFCRTGDLFLRGVYPRGGSSTLPDLASTARFAYALALRGKHDEAEAFLRAILGRASPWSGLIDFNGRQFVNDMENIGLFDTIHAYTGLKATTGWYALETVRLLGLDGPPDGLPAFLIQWLDTHGFSGADVDTQTVEKGGRHVTLREAFLLGENPLDPNDVARVRDFTRDGEGGLTVEMDTLPNRLYQIEVSPDLSENSWAAHGSPTPGTGGPLTVHLAPSATGEPVFVRVRITYP